MLSKEQIRKEIELRGRMKSADFVARRKISRQYVAKLLSELTDEGSIIKIGSTRSAFYVSRKYAKDNPENIPFIVTLTFPNKNVEEHTVLEEVKRRLLSLSRVPENIRSIFEYAFLEMLNNAIEHSISKKITVHVRLQHGVLTFEIADSGIGVFRNIKSKRNLSSEIEAMQELLKGKTTTAPKLHSGEGIFFTSKVGDLFILDSFGYQLVVDNQINDVFIKKVRGQTQGTRVTFTIKTSVTHHLNDIFKAYTNKGKKGDHGFDKTEIHVRLYALGGVHISRSQARRVLSGLEKFKVIVMDYDKVPTVGQAFADEIYRVFRAKYPDIEIQDTNMNEAVAFMVKRAKIEARVGR